MSNIKTEKRIYKNFGECLTLTNGLVQAVITIDVGPRILYFGFLGGENFLYEDPKRVNVQSGGALEAVFGKGSKWFNYGGHRLWVSPEDMPLTYYPDNEPVVYMDIPGGVELVPPAQRVNDLQYRIEVVMSEDKPALSVKHYISNIGESSKRCAPWAITVLGQGGLEVVPQPVNDTGLLANRVLSVWPYTNMADERVFWGDKYITLRQKPGAGRALKYGINNLAGWAAYFIGGGLFIKRYNCDPAGTYPDYGTSFETYTDGEILEMETLGRLIDLTPGSTMFHAESWSIVADVERPDPRDEDAIDKAVKKYIEE